MKIIVLGWFNHQNCGDEAYKLSFPLVLPGHLIKFTETLKNIDLSEIDIIILGGGDVVKQSFIDDIKKYSMNIPVIAMSVTITNGSNLNDLKLFKRIIVRDKISLSIAKQFHDDVHLFPDFTFILSPNRLNGRRLLKEKFAESGHLLTHKVISVIMNSYISFNFDGALARDTIAFDKVVHEIARLAEQRDESFVFIPFSTKSPWDDRSPNSWIADRCKNKYEKNLCIYDRLTPQETLDIIGASDAVISTRLHSSIFSTICGIPFIDILHHDKNFGYMKTIDKVDWTTWLWNYEPDKISNLINEFLSNGGRDESLYEFTENAKEQLKNVSKLIL